MNRRDFLKSVSLVCAGVLALPLVARSEERRRSGGSAAPAGGAPALVDPNSSEAKALSYQPTHAAIKDKKLQVQKDGVEWSKQSCATCTLYQGKKGDKNGGCAVFVGKNVVSTGWCTSWSLKK